MTSRRSAVLALGLALAVLTGAVLGGCGPRTQPTSSSLARPTRSGTAPADPHIVLPADQSPVDVMPLWADGTGHQAFNALARTLDLRYEGKVSFHDMVASGTRDDLVDPSRHLDALGTRAGRAGAADVALGRVQDVSGLYDELGLGAVWPAGLKDDLALDGTLYALPYVVARTNLLWSNRAVLADAGLDPDATYATVRDWIDALHAVDDAGEQAIVVGTDWTQLLLFEDLLLSEAGARGLADLWAGRGDWNGPAVARAIADLREILDLANDDRATLYDDDLGSRVGKGKAAFAVMGSWIAEVVGEHHRVAGEDYGVTAVPGTVGSFAFTEESFGWGATSTHPDGARAWLETTSSGPGQRAVARVARGRIPVRTDVDPAGLTALQRSLMADSRTDDLVLSAVDGGPLTLEDRERLAARVAAFGDGKIGAGDLVAALVEATRGGSSGGGGS